MPRALLALLASLLIAGLIAGCGGDDSGEGDVPEIGESHPAPPASDFPKPEGRSLAEVVKSAGRAEVVVSPAALAFYKGENRYPFGVFEFDRTQVPDAKVALYISKAPAPKAGKREKPGKGAVARARTEALNAPAMGPFPAKIESLATKPAFRAQTTNPDDATVVYTSQIDFPSDGEWRIAALIEEDGELTGTVLPSAIVGQFKSIPREGEKAPVINTPTADDAGADLASITTRIPPDTQNRVDFADVVGKDPVVLLFATPQFCESRVCGPVVDVAEQVKQERDDGAQYIHVEIYKDNIPDPDNIRPQVRAFGLPTEPWLFVIDREGKVRTAVEGAFGLELLNRAVDEVTG